MKRAPNIFLGHGSPMNVIEENSFNQNMKNLGRSLDSKNIRAILCLSAHHQTHGIVINDGDHPRTIHDFSGFPDILYQMQYSAPGSHDIAHLIAQKLDLPEVRLNNDWGFDHGAWSVLWHLQPERKIPVIMMSLNFQYSFMEHYLLGQKLRELREDGIMILGSGNIVHSFRGIQVTKDAIPHQNSVIFNEYVRDKILTRDHKSLTQFPENMHEAAQFAVNSSEHYIPFLYVLGASYDDEKPQIFNDKIVMSTMSMMSICFDSVRFSSI